MNILVTNDDGIRAPGLLALKSCFESAGHKVFVMAPDGQKSCKSHSITLGHPIRVLEHVFEDGSIGYACDGYPADCVFLGVLEFFVDQIDFVISGINPGPNLAYDISYSGTVGAAFEALGYNIPSMAVSVNSYDVNCDFYVAAKVALRVFDAIVLNGAKNNIAYNLNVPDLTMDEIKGIACVQHGQLRYFNTVDKIKDPFGRIMYFIAGDLKDDHEEDTDVYMMNHGYATLTPISRLKTDLDELENIAAWNI